MLDSLSEFYMSVQGCINRPYILYLIGDSKWGGLFVGYLSFTAHE